MCVHACVRACVRVCVRACVRACLRFCFLCGWVDVRWGRSWRQWKSACKKSNARTKSCTTPVSPLDIQSPHTQTHTHTDTPSCVCVCVCVCACVSYQALDTPSRLPPYGPNHCLFSMLRTETDTHVTWPRRLTNPVVCEQAKCHSQRRRQRPLALDVSPHCEHCVRVAYTGTLTGLSTINSGKSAAPQHGSGGKHGPASGHTNNNAARGLQSGRCCCVRASSLFKLPRLACVQDEVLCMAKLGAPKAGGGIGGAHHGIGAHGADERAAARDRRQGVGVVEECVQRVKRGQGHQHQQCRRPWKLVWMTQAATRDACDPGAGMQGPFPH